VLINCLGCDAMLGNLLIKCELNKCASKNGTQENKTTSSYNICKNPIKYKFAHFIIHPIQKTTNIELNPNHPKQITINYLFKEQLLKAH
jgi:hypothetical protein